MVSVYGDIQAKDEYTHPLGAEKHFNESMYFNFFDQGQGRGGFLRIGNRANEGYADAGCFREAVLGHVRRNVRDKLLETNPSWLGAAEGGGEPSSGG